MKSIISLKVSIILLISLFYSCRHTSNNETILNSIGAKGHKEQIEINKDDIKLFDIYNNGAEKVVIPKNVLGSLKINLADLISSIEIIPLETSPNSIIGKVHNILFCSNYYFIHDKRNNKLLRFNHNGEFLNNIGTIGKGPGELLSISDIAINDKKKFISILDTKLRKIFRYKFSGEIIDSRPLYYMIWQHEYGEHNSIFTASKVQKNLRTPSIASYSLILADSNSVPLGLGFKNPDNPNSLVSRKPLRKFGDKIYYHHPYSDGIWRVDDSGLVPEIKFEYDEKGLPSDAWERNLNSDEFRQLLSNHLYFSGDYLIAGKFCFFEVFGNERGAFLFYNKESKSLMYGNGFKFNKEKPLTILVTPPLACKNDGTFIGIRESNDIYGLKNHIWANEKIKKYVKESDWEKISKIKQMDNPVIITYKLKDF
ncbi:hypothetical protein BWZ22_12710 [Seonamhaeicola sp. S2-3]|uniref:6-bladed beta-propeller n=1 Tax=Seonamhaeicola sp. S2-3 TaxID=1936081 RepID=UPI000972C0EC|nr:6-bladed beta-propeller [Seonamhaeicola sp. S2-3]APY12036.1 hypothetical protein BWZ22_12710 [Seonamhaeicola sp. S2-3]